MTIEVKRNWRHVKLVEVAEVNPKLPNRDNISDDLEVQFLPMKLVEEVSGRIELSETRTYGEVRKGYTPFIDGDVIFAKVTPCMENGKMAVVGGLKNGIGFGSSEFHVIRSKGEISNKYAFYYFVQAKFRREAENDMTGAVGLRRVPKQFLENYVLPLPPLVQQKQIVSKIEELFSELDRSIEELELAQQQLKVYRQAVLKWAFEGKLTNNDVKEGELPEGWKWTSFGKVCTKIQDGSHFSPQKQYSEPGEGRFMYITAKNIRNDYMDLSKLTYVDKEFHDSIFQRCNPEFGDVLLTKDGVNTGEVTLNTQHEPFSLLSSVCIFKTDKTMLLSAYLKYFIQSPFGAKAIANSMTGTAIKRIILRKIKVADIVVPPVDEQEQVVQEIESRLSQCDKIEETITTSLQQAESLRQSILKKAFEGKLLEAQ